MAGRGPKEHRDGHFMVPKEDILDKLKLPAVNVKYLIEKIEKVSPNHMDQALYEAANTFKTVCVDLGVMKDVMLNLHSKAMSNPKFGEKYITVLGQLSNHIVDNVPVRSELLSFIENEFKIKETMFQSDTAKFINAVMLLGNVYHLVKIHGVPLKVLAVPMLEYLNLLLEGREDHHRVFAIQILLNGDKIFRTDSLGSRLGLLKQSMRKTLIARELTPKSKCWILLALDFMSNDLKPLSGDLINFYVEALGGDYLHVSHLLKQSSNARENIEEKEKEKDREREKEKEKEMEREREREKEKEMEREKEKEKEREREREKKKSKSVTWESNTTDSGDVFKDIENLTIPPEVLNAASTKSKPARIHRFPASGSRLNNNSNNIKEREERNSHHTGGRESHQRNYDEDDLYGIQIERDRIRKTLVKRN